MFIRKIALTAASVAALLAVAGCGQEASTQSVSFKGDVKPILQQRCGACHDPGGEGAEKSGLLLDSYYSVMKGTRFGPVVVPGSSIDSTLWRLVAGKADPTLKMPHGQAPLTEDQINTIAAWIDQGAEEN